MCNIIVTDPVNAVKDISHVNQALSKWWYSVWAFKKVKQQLHQKATEPKKSKTTKKDQRLPSPSPT